MPSLCLLPLRDNEGSLLSTRFFSCSWFAFDSVDPTRLLDTRHDVTSPRPPRCRRRYVRLYVAGQSYDRMVLAVFENRRINERVKAYKLSTLFKCGPIKASEWQNRIWYLALFLVPIHLYFNAAFFCCAVWPSYEPSRTIFFALFSV